MLKKRSDGLYYKPEDSIFGKVPAHEVDLVKAFLKDHRFVMMSPNDYNALGVSTTQLYDETRVCNYKRHGEFKLGNRVFRFIRKPYVPTKMIIAFFNVELMNNLKKTAF